MEGSDIKNLHGVVRRQADDDTKHRIDDEGPGRNEKGGGEIGYFAMGHIPGGVSDPEETNLQDQDLPDPAEKHVGRLVNHDTGKGRDGN